MISKPTEFLAGTGDVSGAKVDLNAHEAGNGGSNQGEPKAHCVHPYSDAEPTEYGTSPRPTQPRKDLAGSFGFVLRAVPPSVADSRAETVI